MKKENRIPILILLAHVAVLFLYHWYGYIGHYGFDDMAYAKIASNLLNGQIDFNDHYTYRFPIVFFTALSYKLLGISDFSSSLPTLVFTTLTLVLVFAQLRREKVGILLFGLSTTTFSSWFLFYSDKLMPDAYVTFSFVLTLFIIHQFRFGKGCDKPFVYSLFLALTLLFGFMAKETIFLIIPLLGYLFIWDIWHKKNIRFWLFSIINGIIVLVAYFFVIWMLTGDFIKRFEAISTNGYLNSCSYDKQPLIIVFKRVAYEFWNMMVYQAMVTGFIFILGFSVRKNIRNYLNIDNTFSFYLVSSIILVLTSNFLSISPTSYVPLCLDPRHYLFLIPIAGIASAFIIWEFVQTRQSAVPIIIVSLLVALLSFFLEGHSFSRLYLPLSILLTGYYFVKITRTVQWIFISLLMLILIINLYKGIEYAQRIDYRGQRAVVEKYLLNQQSNCYILTDVVQSRLGDYYKGFDTNKTCSFLAFNETNTDTLKPKNTFLLLNWYTQYLSNLNENDLPYYAKNIDPAYTLVYKDERLLMSIYKMGKIENPLTDGTLLFSSIDGFEGKTQFWEQDTTCFTRSNKHSGQSSVWMNWEYSPTFSYPFDSLGFIGYTKIMIHANVYCNVQNKTKAEVIIALQNKNETYLWYSSEINKYLKAYGNWSPVSMQSVINSSDIKPGSILKVYIWNIGKQEMNLDDFEVKIIGIK